MTTYEFWTNNPEPVESGNLDVQLKCGQKVRITRTLTYSYEVDIQDVLDMTDEETISVKDLKEGEEDLSYEDSPNPETDDDIVISVEIL